jgi:hypothetical protein
MRVEFEETGHRYTLHHDDGRTEEIPSVTTILTMAGIIQPGKYLPGAAEHGTIIHSMTETLDQFPEAFGENCAEAGEFAPYLRAYLDAVVEYDIKMLETESVVYGWTFGQYYGGKLDRIASYRPFPGAEPRIAVIDIKTGVAAKWHQIQLTAYRIPLNRYEELDMAALYIAEDGGYKLRVVHSDDQPGAYNSWCNAVQTAYRLAAERRARGEEPWTK